MRVILYTLMVMLSLAIGASAALARDMVSTCTLQNNAQLSLNFNGYHTDILAIRDLMDKKIAEIQQLAKEQAITSLQVTSKNMNINSNEYAGNEMAGYQYNGNISFTVMPGEKSYGLLDLLHKKNYNVSLSTNSYQNGTCNH